MTEEEYPYSKYPPYCHGPFYLMSYNAMLQLIDLFEQEYHRNYIWIEDIFLTGIFYLVLQFLSILDLLHKIVYHGHGEIFGKTDLFVLE